MQKPRKVFDRELEWSALSRFVSDESTRGLLGVVYGRRRQGKSWLLEHVSRLAGGWYWESIEGTARQQLDAFSTTLARWTGLAAAPRFSSWSEALQSVWRARPAVVVLDEFQRLVGASPELPSVLQGLLSRRDGPRVVVCGSALGKMRALLGSEAPLRGRASLELVVRPFDFRTAARYWRLGTDLSRAVRLHALVGGTPAYLDFAAGRSPADFETFDDWVCGVLLDPAGALFREGRILTDEPDLQDRGLYHGILAAVAAGRTRRGQIAAALGRPDNTLAHPLNALVELALLERIDDPLHARRSTFRLAEPLLRTYQTLIAPNEGAIERRGAPRVWKSLSATASSQIYGPHFEHLAREWTATWASERTTGGLPRNVGPSSASDPALRKEMEIDVVATAGDRVLAIGEAKWTSTRLDLAVLAELERRRALVGPRAESARLLLFGSSGFAPRLRQAARVRHDVELVDLKRLYGGE